MSRASEIKKLAAELPTFPLMKVKQASAFLHCSDDQVRSLAKAGRLPFSNVGLSTIRPEYRFDPYQVVVFHLAGEEDLTVAAFWKEHGPQGTMELCRGFITRLRNAVNP